MDDARKKSYRMLLRSSATRTRALLSVRDDDPTLPELASAARALADLMHNLAYFSALDFEGFVEDWHWNVAEAIVRDQPQIASYADRVRFEQDLRTAALFPEEPPPDPPTAPPAPRDFTLIRGGRSR